MHEKRNFTTIQNSYTYDTQNNLNNKCQGTVMCSSWNYGVAHLAPDSKPSILFDIQFISRLFLNKLFNDFITIFHSRPPHYTRFVWHTSWT